MLTIESRSNEKIKYASCLGESAKKRAERNEFLLEGARLCRDAVQSGLEVRTAFFTAQALEKYAGYAADIIAAAQESYQIAPHLAEKLAGTAGSQGVFCVCKIPEKMTPETLDINGKYLALENIQDPANFGAICRTAEALGLTGLIVSGGCDIYNPKALRSAMGSSLRIALILTDNLPCLLRAAEDMNIKTYASTPDCGAKDIRSIASEGGAIAVVGNEGSGISNEVFASCSGRVTIPMKGNAESLNAAAAAAILGWELMRS